MTNFINISQLSVQVPDEQEVSSLCYSSLSESSLSSNEEEKAVEARDDSPLPKAIITNDVNDSCDLQNEAKKKAVRGRYSRLAFSVRQIGADKRK